MKGDKQLPHEREKEVSKPSSEFIQTQMTRILQF